jgi:uncharacterized hydantoinase/oxoprolinase family protein
MTKRYKTVGWYVPAHVPGYDTARSEAEALATTTLIAFKDGLLYNGIAGTYIPVFGSQTECDSFVKQISEEHKDLAFTICKFETLADVYKQVSEDFDEQEIRIIVKESNEHEV